MKTILAAIALLILASMVYAGDVYIYPTFPGTNLRDYSKPGYIINRDQIKSTLPGTTLPDYSQPWAVMDRDAIYPTLPGTTLRDFSRPGWQVDD